MNELSHKTLGEHLVCIYFLQRMGKRSRHILHSQVSAIPLSIKHPSAIPLHRLLSGAEFELNMTRFLLRVSSQGSFTQWCLSLLSSWVTNLMMQNSHQTHILAVRSLSSVYMETLWGVWVLIQISFPEANQFAQQYSSACIQIKVKMVILPLSNSDRKE